MSTVYTHTEKPWQVTDEMGRTSTTTYDALGRPVVVYAPAVDGVQATHLTAYDAAGNVIRVTDPLGREADTEYDRMNRPVAVYAPTVWDAQAGQFVRPSTQTTYDFMGQVLTVTDPQGNVTTKFYDEAGRNWKVVAPVPEAGVGAPVTTTTFDAGGLALTVTNALGQTVTNTYDIHGRLITTEDAEHIVNHFEYDVSGNRTSVKDGLNQETTFAYDGLNRVTSQTFANGDTVTSSYDPLRKISQTSPRGITTRYAYDKRDRMLRSTAPGLNRHFSYDAAGHLLGVTEDGKPAANVSYSYDALGRVTSETSRGTTHTYIYDLAGNRIRAEYGTGRSVQTSYDALNRPELISEGGRVTRYGYDLAGRAVVLVAGNGQTSNNTYDNLGRLTDRTLFKTAAMSESDVLAQFSWEHDALGNVTRQLETWPGESSRTPGIRSTAMTYDANNRLHSETVVEPSAAQTTTVYAYDAANNRSSKTVTGGSDPGVWHYTYNAANQLKSWVQQDPSEGTELRSAVLNYDAAGNRISQHVSMTGGATGNGINPPPAAGGETIYQWDAQDRLSSVTLPNGETHSYDYDYRTRRIGTHKVVSGVQQKQTAIVFAGGLSLAEYDIETATLPTTPTVEYTRGPDMGGGVGGMLYSMRASGTKYSLSNGRGDIVAQADSSATLTWTASYEAYGRRTKETGSNKDKQRSNSKDEDPTGLLNEGFRYRDLETGVWTSRDPAGFVDGPNVYAYVKQNPWTAFDPHGLAGKLNKIGEVYERLFKNGYKVGRKTVRNMQFAGKTVDSQMLRKSTSVSEETLKKLDLEFPGASVKYNQHGRPIFDDFAKETVNVKFEESAKDIKQAWEKIESKYSPKEIEELKQTHVFHHDWDGKKLQLVPKTIHDAFQHTGGDALRKAGFFSSVGAFFAPRTSEGKGSTVGNIVQDIGEFSNPDPGVVDFIISPAAEATNTYIEKVSTGHPDALNSEHKITRDLARYNQDIREASQD